MRKAFTFLSSLSSKKQSSSKKTKASTQDTSKPYNNVNVTSTKNHNDDLDKKFRKNNSNDLKKSAPELKRLDPITELKRQHLQRKTSDRSTNSVTISTLSNRRRKSLVILKDSDIDSEKHFDEVRIKNTSSMLLNQNRSMTPDYPPRRLQYSPPAAKTPPLVHTPREFLKEPRPRYLEERRFSSSASSSSSASVDSSGSRYHRDNNVSHYHFPLTERIRRVNSIKSNHSRSSSIKSDSNRLVAGANPPPSNRNQKAIKRMSMNEYHKYQREMVSAQYLKHGINPVIDESIPVNLEPNPSRMGSTQRDFVNPTSTRLKKRLSVNDRSCPPPLGQVRNTSYTKTASSEFNDYRRTTSESNIQPPINPRYSKYHLTPLHLHHHSVNSLSSSSGSGGPPSPSSPTSRRSSVMFGSNFDGSRPSTPSSVGNGFTFEKEKRSRIYK
ncbi:4981_t:CDS:2 [Funneliformis caledonium]|uniref:4981_t:CDS:1 n=1 Tax=Funneliformis caledonium TaxID=1117310 RepID=A0A9N9F0S1_9GLOM|nr:4981_t:CDS:2 [Funneliformis caledonium]